MNSPLALAKAGAYCSTHYTSIQDAVKSAVDRGLRFKFGIRSQIRLNWVLQSNALKKFFVRYVEAGVCPQELKQGIPLQTGVRSSTGSNSKFDSEKNKATSFALAG